MAYNIYRDDRSFRRYIAQVPLNSGDDLVYANVELPEQRANKPTIELANPPPLFASQEQYKSYTRLYGIQLGPAPDYFYYLAVLPVYL